MHPAAFAFVQTVAPRRPKGLVLEIGGRNINGSVRALFLGDPFLSIDVVPGPGVDVVADGADFVPAVMPTCVICCEVMEHTPAAAAICRQAHAILAPGGQFIVTAAGDGRAPHSAMDGGTVRPGEFYRNVAADELRAWLAPFAHADVTENPADGDIYAVATKGTA